MHSLFSFAFVAAVANALPARDYNAVPPSSTVSEPVAAYTPHGKPIYGESIKISSSKSDDWSKPYYSTVRGYGHHAASSSSSTSSPPSRSKPYVPRKGSTTVTVTAAQATVTVTPDGHLWSPSHPFSGAHAGSHGACDSSSGPYASTSNNQQSNSYSVGHNYDSGSNGFYGSAGYPAGVASPIQHDGPVETLTPIVHWNVDTAPAANVIPVPVGHGCPQYYAQGGNTDADTEHIFGTVTYQFLAPFVNLDYAAQAKSVLFSGSSLSVSFTSFEAYSYAVKHWGVGTILNTHTTDCGDESGKGCYFVIDGLDFSQGSLSVSCSGTPSRIEDIISYGEAEWGVYAPGQSDSGSGSSGSKTSATASYGPHSSSTLFSSLIRPTSTSSGVFGGMSFSASPSSSSLFGGVKPSATASSGASSTIGSLLPSATGLPSTNSTGNSTELTDFNKKNATCVGPIDTKYGLPTACLGDFFDADLDSFLGAMGRDASEFKAWLEELAPGADAGDLEPVAFKLRRRIIQERGLFSWFAQKVIAPAAAFVAKKVEQAVDLGKAVIKAVAEATTIRGDFTTNLSMQIPKAQAPTDGKVIASPWGNSVLIKAFGSQEKGDTKTGEGASGYLNVFCVDCGAKGNAQLSGKAGFSPLGITEGQVGVVIDLDIVLKLGVDAQLKYKKDFRTNLFTVGLPGLDFAVVKIGPMISLDSRVGLEAAGNGRLLAGAEFGLKKAQATLDIISPSKSSKSGWTPYFQPVFQADGEIMLGAELGLPIGLKVGVKVLTFEKSLGLYDEPSIRATAQVAATVGLTEAGTFAAGFKETNGCTGISTQVSWRNKLWVDVLGLTNVDLMDSGDNKLAQGCIALPAAPSNPGSEPTTPGTEPETPSTEPTTPSTEPTTPGAGPTSPDSSGGEGSSAPSTGGESTAGEGGEAPSGKLRKRIPRAPSLDFPKLMYKRQSNTTTTPSVNGTSSTNGTVKDLTNLVVTSTTAIDYNDINVKANPYNRTDGYEFTLMVDQGLEYLVTSCSNGNVYVQGINAETPDPCSDLWAARDDITATDGNERIMHYYNNTMAKVGVSRLRVASQDQLPKQSVPVALAPIDLSADPNAQCTTCSGKNSTQGDIDDNTLYFAVDIFENIFFTAVCTYTDKNVPKLFVINDVEAGLAMLKSPDVEYSITGGKVEECFVLPLIQGSDDPNSYEAEDKTDEDGKDDSLSLDWDAGEAPEA